MSGNESFLKMQMAIGTGEQVRELDSYHFSFSLPCYLSPHPCRACWQELINLFMGWTELAPIIQGVELLNGGNKRLYPLPTSHSLPSFQDSMKLCPICTCNSCIQLGRGKTTQVSCERNMVCCQMPHLNTGLIAAAFAMKNKLRM